MAPRSARTSQRLPFGNDAYDDDHPCEACREELAEDAQ